MAWERQLGIIAGITGSSFSEGYWVKKRDLNKDLLLLQNLE